MNEARRFLRYIFPGMIFFILLSLYLFISARGQLLKAVKGFMQGAGGGGGVLQAGVFILFVAGVGYFFATIYLTCPPQIGPRHDRGFLRNQPNHR